MSPRRTFDMRISLPPRLAMTRTGAGHDSPLSSPASSAPHTPMPYDLVQTPDTTSQHFQDAMYFDDRESISSAGSKRGREEDDEEAAKWTEEDVDTIQAALLHPFRPLSSSFPPGELPPPSVLDELTHQIVKYAYRPSPVKRGRSKQPPKPRPHEDGWSHTWDATRRKLFRVALAESQSAHGMDAEDKKLPRVERVQRPGLKRMDSMDFLDQEQEEEVADRGVGSSGLAAQLSTSLQNTARSNPLGFLSRTQSDDVTTTTSSISASTSTPTALETPAIPAAITITPASPVAAPPLRRRGSSRVSQPRSSRPSLLQRGRSFTASDLEADPSIPDSPIAPAKTARGDAVTIPPTAAAAMASLQAGPTLLDAPSSSRLTRSRSGLTLNPHPCRTAFLADRKPTTTEKCALALPFDAGPIRGPARTQPVNGGWSDSDDEQSSKVRHVKKVKPARNSRPLMMMTPALQPALQAEMLGGPDLRSPFEEKSGMTC